MMPLRLQNKSRSKMFGAERPCSARLTSFSWTITQTEGSRFDPRYEPRHATYMHPGLQVVAAASPIILIYNQKRSNRCSPLLPLRERVSECASRSSLHLPDRRAVFLVLELDSHRIELVANLIRYLEVLRL